MRARDDAPTFLLTLLSLSLLTYASCSNPDLSQGHQTCSTEDPECPDGQACIDGCCGGCRGKALKNLDFKSTPYAAGLFSDRIAQADFNGDGKLDLAIAYSQASTVGIHLGNGDGTFVMAGPVRVPRSKTLQVTAADLNADKRVDLVVADSAGNAVLVLLGFGDGTFAPPQSYSGDGSPAWTAVGDFDRDGHLDIATIDGVNSTANPLLLGTGNGSFSPSKVALATGMNPSGLTVVDINQDSALDIVTCNFTSNDVSILLGNGDGTFRSQLRFATGQRQNGVVVADFNKDGRADIATTDAVANAVTLLIGTSDGTTFAPGRKIVTDIQPYGLVVADFDNDGNLDLATTNPASNDVSVLLGKGDGTFQAAHNFPVGKAPVFLVTGDWNADGKVDLAVANSLDSSYSILLNVSQ